MTTPLGSAYANPPGIRLDPEPLDPAWQAPESSRPPGDLAWLIGIAVLLLVLGTVWIGGGFDRRQDRVQAYPSGTTIHAGSFTFTLERADVRKVPAASYSDDPPQWEVRAYGTATNVTDEPLTLYQIGVIGLADGAAFGGQSFQALAHTTEGFTTTRSGKLEPGMADLPIRITAEVPEDWEPTGHVFVGVREQSYAAHEVDQGFTAERWSTDRNGQAVGFWLPVRILPEGRWD